MALKIPIAQALFGLLLAAQEIPPPLPLEQVVERMVRADDGRAAAMAGYTGMRRYRFENKRVNKRAEIVVRFTCTHAGVKTFQVVSESGSAFVRAHILRKMIEAEVESSQKGDREESRILPKNYEFRPAGTGSSDGHPAYLLDLVPRTKNKFLIQGRVWVDAGDYAITRIEGSPARNPSFWIKSVKIEHRYARVGGFWLPAANSSVADARIFGASEVTIEYFDYVLAGAGAGGVAEEEAAARAR